MYKRFRCKLSMNLQTFAEGGTADGGGGSGAEGGTPPTGTQQTPQFDYDKLASLIAGKQSVTEESVLKGYFKQQRNRWIRQLHHSNSSRRQILLM